MRFAFFGSFSGCFCFKKGMNHWVFLCGPLLEKKHSYCIVNISPRWGKAPFYCEGFFLISILKLFIFFLDGDCYPGRKHIYPTRLPLELFYLRPCRLTWVHLKITQNQHPENHLFTTIHLHVFGLHVNFWGSKYFCTFIWGQESIR